MSTHAINTTRGVPFEPGLASAQRAEFEQMARRVREEEERAAYREYLPQQIRAIRRRKHRA